MASPRSGVAQERVEIEPLAVERVRDGEVMEQDDPHVADERGDQVFQRLGFGFRMADPRLHLRLTEIEASAARSRRRTP